MVLRTWEVLRKKAEPPRTPRPPHPDSINSVCEGRENGITLASSVEWSLAQVERKWTLLQELALKAWGVPVLKVVAVGRARGVGTGLGPNSGRIYVRILGAGVAVNHSQELRRWSPTHGLLPESSDL